MFEFFNHIIDYIFFSENGEGYLLKTTTESNGRQRILDGDSSTCLPEDASHSCSKAGTGSFYYTIQSG